jgi:UDP-2,4-diacetamido-2,4,6-trideoxy-beta-L-altropyranose hydrolase
MQIVFRTDASTQIGTGHVMRCLTLADALRLEGADCMFICRGHDGHLINLIRHRGHHAVMLEPCTQRSSMQSKDSLAHAAWLSTNWENDAAETLHAIDSRSVDWLVVDHYALDHHWEKFMRPFSRKIMVIDDLADRIHDCDLLLDQNLGRSAEDYRSLVPDHINKLIGPRYALLRPEFSALREKSLARRQHPQLQHLLITLGGVDKDNLTDEVLQALRICNLPLDLRITVVMGPHAPWLGQVQTIAAAMPRSTQVMINVRDMASLMTASDLVICAAGGTVWECCSLGLPSFVIAAAENQRSAAFALKKSGAVQLIDNTRDVATLIEDTLLSGAPAPRLQQLSTAASIVTEGNGSTLVLKEMQIEHA